MKKQKIILSKDALYNAFTLANLKIIGLILAVGFVFIQIPKFIRLDRCLESSARVCSDTIGFNDMFILFVSPIIGLMVLKYFRKIKWADIGFARPPLGLSLKLILGGVPLIAALNIILGLLAEKVPILGQEQFGLSGDVTFVSILPFAFFAVVLAPLVEEIMFRGFQFSIIGRRFGVAWGAVISSLSFGLVHGQIGPGIVTLFLGLYFCFMFIKTKSLFPNIALHILNNLTAIIILVATN